MTEVTAPKSEQSIMVYESGTHIDPEQTASGLISSSGSGQPDPFFSGSGKAKMGVEFANRRAI